MYTVASAPAETGSVFYAEIPISFGTVWFYGNINLYLFRYFNVLKLLLRPFDTHETV